MNDEFYILDSLQLSTLTNHMNTTTMEKLANIFNRNLGAWITIGLYAIIVIVAVIVNI